jgi:hypothetical protein
LAQRAVAQGHHVACVQRLAHTFGIDQRDDALARGTGMVK